MQEWKRERVCGRGVALWDPAVRKSTHPFSVVEESEVGGQCFILERCCHWGIPLSLTAVGIVRTPDKDWSTEVPMERVKDPLGEQDPLV
jgi:hypothetical protein